jgi:hypothetical protein
MHACMQASRSARGTSPAAQRKQQRECRHSMLPSSVVQTYVHGLLCKPSPPHFRVAPAGCDDLDVPHRCQQAADVQRQTTVSARPLRLWVRVDRAADNTRTHEQQQQQISTMLAAADANRTQHARVWPDTTCRRHHQWAGSRKGRSSS